jgi:hypothetical protein
MNRALFDRNATACERSTSRRCRCACGGQFHGVSHPLEWRDATYTALEAARLESIAPVIWCAHGVAFDLPCDACRAELRDCLGPVLSRLLPESAPV